MAGPQISVLMATWNRAELLDATIESVREQTLSNWELIITDDGSTDRTEEVVLRWQKKEPRIKYVRSAVNQGISKNYNQGLKLTSAEYIAMIDDDDPWCDPKKLEKQVAFLNSHPDYVGCGGGVVVVDGEGNELYRYLKPQTDSAIRARMLFSNPMANSTTVFRRTAAEKAHWYDESIRYSGDRDFWLKLGLLGKLYNAPEYYAYYTMTGANTSISKLRPHLKTSLLVMRRYRGKYPGYFLAFLLNQIQYAYSFLPEFIRKAIHTTLARLKRKIAG